MQRREYHVDLRINETPINKIIIDPHYEEKHGDSIDDKLIIKLVELLDGQSFRPESENEGFSYFANDLRLDGKLFRIVWLLEDQKLYVGVVNAYRRK